MKVELESLSAPPAEYKQQYFANLVRAIEASLRRIDYAPVYDPEVQRTDAVNPSKALYSTGNTKLDDNFTPTSDTDIIPKRYVDAINTALQEALATLDAARQEAEATLQAAIDEIKGDASLITFDGTDSILTSADVQAALEEVGGDDSTTTSGVVCYAAGTGVPLSETTVTDALDELAGTTTVSGVATYVKGTSGVPLVAGYVNVAIDELAGKSDGTAVTGNIYVASTDYNATGTQDLGNILSEIDSRLTTLEP